MMIVWMIRRCHPEVAGTKSLLFYVDIMKGKEYMYIHLRDYYDKVMWIC